MELSRAMNNHVCAFDSMQSKIDFVGSENFPAVLHNLLEEVEENGYSCIISWQPGGKCFAVHNRKDFSLKIMPIYFRMSKFTSFQRQLNLYAFKRITTGPLKGGYYHEHFVRGEKALCRHILRQPSKGGGHCLSPPPEISFFHLARGVPCPGHKGDNITNFASFSTEMMESSNYCHSNGLGAEFIPSPYTPCVFTTTNYPGLSNTPTGCSQPCEKMTFSNLRDLRDKQAMMATMQVPQPFSNNSPLSPLTFAVPSAFHKRKLEVISTDSNQSHVSTRNSSTSPGYEEIKHNTEISGPSHRLYFGDGHQAVVSSSCQPAFSHVTSGNNSSFEETRRNLLRCWEAQSLVTKESLKALNRNVDNYGGNAPSTSSFVHGRSVGAPSSVGEPFGGIDQDITTVSDGSEFDWTSQNPNH